MPPPTDEVVFASRIRAADHRTTADRHQATHKPLLSVVVPLFNEQDNLPELYRRLSHVLHGLALSYEIILIDDGSRDATAMLVDSYATLDRAVAGIHLSRNFGHQSAITAGLDAARGEAVIVLDGDLQDPPELIPELVARWQSGVEVVYAVRASRAEGFVRKLAYWAYYRILKTLSDHPIPVDAGDFCLMDRRVVDAVANISERTRFVRGLRAFVGFRQAGVPYDRDRRHAGTSKYTPRKLFTLAIDGIFGFGSLPVAIVCSAGTLLLAFSLALGVASRVISSHGSAGSGEWLLAAVFVGVGGLQVLAMAVIGEYLRRISREVSGRPHYIISRSTDSIA